MPGLEDASSVNLTFVVGDPRSDQNRSRIRSHASRAARRPADAENVSIRSEPTPLLAELSPSDSDQHFEAKSSPRSEGEPPKPQRHPWLPDFRHTSERRLRKIQTLYEPTQSSPGLISLNPPLHNPPTFPTERPFSTQGSTVGTWWERYPDTRAAATGVHQFDPHQCLQLVQPLHEPGESVSTGSDGDVQRLAELSTIPISAAFSRPQNPGSFGDKRRSKTGKALVRSEKAKRSAQQLMQGRWRLAATPAKPLAHSPGDPHAQLESFLLRTSNFYQSEFDTTWQVILEQNSAAFQAPAPAQQFDIATISAAALIEAGRVDEASKLIQCLFDSLPHFVHRSNHPSAYYLFINFALTSSSSALAQLYENLRVHLIPISEKILGPGHPISQVLRLRISGAARKQFQYAAMSSIRDMFYQAFGPDSMQTMVQHFTFGRILTKLGLYQEAIDEISALLRSAERSQPLNSLFPVFVLVEKVAAYLAAGDSSIVPELHLNDAFRRLHIISERLEPLPEDDEEKQMMKTPMAVCQMVGLQASGRLQCLRRNFGAAIQAYSQAVHVGVTAFGPYAVPVYLSQADLDATKLEELKHSLEGLSLVSVDGKAPPWPSDCQFHIARTAVGTVRAMNKTYMGKRTEHIPTFQGSVVGYTASGGVFI